MSRKRTVLVRWFLSGFQRIPIDDAVADLAVEIRRTHRMRLSDAIIWASARHVGGLLVTRNTKDFPPDDPGVRVPYTIAGGDDHETGETPGEPLRRDAALRAIIWY